MEENDVFRYFIEGGPLKGVWFIEVPVGLEVITKLAVKEKVSWKEFELNKIINYYSPMVKHIDAVCIIGFQNIIKRKIKLGEWIQIFRDASLNPFAGKRVWLVEAKKDLMSNEAFTAIGQLFYYEHQFQKDWKGKVDGKAIVYGNGTDEVTLDVIKWLKTRFGIVTWHVSDEGKITSIL